MVTEQCLSVAYTLIVADQGGVADVTECGIIAVPMLIAAIIENTAVIIDQAVAAVYIIAHSCCSVHRLRPCCHLHAFHQLLRCTQHQRDVCFNAAGKSTRSIPL